MGNDTDGGSPDVPRIDKRMSLTQLNRMAERNPTMTLEQAAALMEMAKLYSGSYVSIDRVLRAFGVIE